MISRSRFSGFDASCNLYTLFLPYEPLYIWVLHSRTLGHILPPSQRQLLDWSNFFLALLTFRPFFSHETRSKPLKLTKQVNQNLILSLDTKNDWYHWTQNFSKYHPPFLQENTTKTTCNQNLKYIKVLFIFRCIIFITNL